MGVDDLYPEFDNGLRLLAGASDLSAALAPGPDYHELVYESAMIDLEQDTKTRFALTIWYEGPDNRERPALAEISFSYDTDDGEVAAEVAKRSRELLLLMQDLDWADPALPTKTALAGCAG
jgi:hypothetical protein